MFYNLSRALGGMQSSRFSCDTPMNRIHTSVTALTHGFQDGNWEVLTCCPWFESDFLRNCKSVLIKIWFQMLPRIWLI
jgi:hypothetical protein